MLAPNSSNSSSCVVDQPYCSPVLQCTLFYIAKLGSVLSGESRITKGNNSLINFPESVCRHHSCLLMGTGGSVQPKQIAQAIETAVECVRIIASQSEHDQFVVNLFSRLGFRLSLPKCFDGILSLKWPHKVASQRIGNHQSDGIIQAK